AKTKFKLKHKLKIKDEVEDYTTGLLQRHIVEQVEDLVNIEAQEIIQITIL
ncbi:306_t:CDS:1, partial [Racocetra persica]